MNGVERMRAYLGISTEAPAVVPGSRPPKAWPSAGEISVESLVVRYRPDLPPVLQGLSFSVEAGEKVGIAGRTGCGKVRVLSILCMLRVCVPDVWHDLSSV
jgi:ATP-binding cassette, subfamily C (CFTR/MRP), member 1